MVAAEPQRRMRFLDGLGLHRRVLELEELAVQADSLLGPQSLHHPEPLGEAGGAARRGQSEGRVDPRIAAEADTEIDPPAAQLIEGRDALGEVDRAPQRGQEHGGPEPDPLGARGGVRQQRDRLEAPDRAQDLLDDPHALEAERLGPGEESADAAHVEAARENRLRNRDAEPYSGGHGRILAHSAGWYS